MSECLVTGSIRSTIVLSVKLPLLGNDILEEGSISLKVGSIWNP